MKSFFDLSFRSKIPLWGGLLIVVTALSISASLLFRMYDDLEQDMAASADSLGRAVASTLFPALLHEDVWRAYELIDAPFRGIQRTNPMQAEKLLVIDTGGKVIVSTQPERMPMLADLARLGADYADLATRLPNNDKKLAHALELKKEEHYYFAIPIADEETQLGTLVLVYSRSALMRRFFESAWRVSLIGLIIMAVLLPLNWYWGRRMAVPLAQLTERMERLGANELPDDLDPALYPYRDELGRLFDAYELMLGALREKAILEKEMVRSERLAAVGQLTAGIAHEINNPLGGMLTAINTLKHHGDGNPRTLKTISLIERGLLQIKETVAALLVEARVNSRNLSPHDIEDIHTLIQPQAQKKSLKIDYRGSLAQEVPLPANLLRQIFINLLLNAVQAANERGIVWCNIALDDKELMFEVGNDGQQITQAQRERLFEPFVTHRESGHGLGLWVTYQIMQTLGGRIVVTGDDDITRFAVHIPFGATV
ncbi:HAMP domain-containing sensor histidine kinase [Herbaspirillum sp. ST 5-3]|uniref:sensor histidine kinase n=1 Tax=Oxalobacteraceae TaxID=75682 RepID=UPI0010A2C111|nr:HAMP domain-containing sensor histidine kinase [Herbaspirillum sp. ST 5-3]